jgi:hypothetical protein
VLRAAVLVAATVVVIASPTAGAEPSTPPPNDSRANATSVHPPASIRGTTVGATDEKNDPRPSCGRVESTVWYRIGDAPSGRIVLRLHAEGDLDGVLAVYQVRRSQLIPVTCDATDDNGRAEFVFDATGGANYLILFGRLPTSVDGTFSLKVTAPGPSSRPPGTPLPAKGVRSTLDPLDRPDKAWSTVMQAGTTYKMNLVPRRGQCVAFSLFAPGTRDFKNAAPVIRRECGGYVTYTPGPDLGGRYSIFVEARGSRSVTFRYRLQVAPAGPEDIGPGRPLANQQTRKGSLNGSRLNVVNFFHFDVARQSDVTLRLRAGARAQFDLVLLSDTGRILDCGCGGSGGAYMRRGLSAGHYFAVVRAREGSGGSYRLSLLIREITQTQALVAGSRLVTLPPGQTANVEVRVTPGSAGRVHVRIDRFLPLDGWVFSRLVSLQTSADGVARFSWRPPALGRWRLRAFFRGSRVASPSSSAYLIVNVRS